ncbi:ATP-binding protein [Propionibacteriaceae bacterium Y1923]|uniref:ATP-binding protein n=1 Tax=Aestuariimicrobium sp. Y1814 TaxID=3418742 RepID=UPI003C16A0BE
MTRRMVLHGLGTAVALELGDGSQGTEADEALWKELATAWSRCRLDDTAPVADTVTAALTAQSPDELMVWVTQRVTQALIGARRGELVMFHAGGLAHPTTGASLVFVAPGGTGKSTLARALGQQYGYLSDETIGLDADGLIQPYPKPISLRRPAGEPGPKRELSPDALGLLPAPGEPRLARLVLLTRDPQATGLTVDDLDTLGAIEALINETSSLSQVPRALHRLADLLAIGGGAQRWTYPDHTELLPAVADILGAA